MERFGTLELPQLSTLSVKEGVEHWVDRSFDRYDVEGESDEEGSITRRRRTTQIPMDLPSHAGVQDPIPTRPTILNRLRDGGVGLTRLSLCLDLDSQWVSLTFDL